MVAIVFASANPHKLGEVAEILGAGFAVRGLDALPPAPEVEEAGTTFAENAALKALAASRRCAEWVLADDSGLEVDALGGAPSVRSARFAGEQATDAENVALLLEKLRAARGRERTARFRCVLSLARGGRQEAVFDGTVEGIIAPSPRGSNGFGYDPVFIPEGYCASFGVLEPEVKHRLSHRARALEELKKWFAAGRGAA